MKWPQRHAAKRSEAGDSAGAYGLYQAATSRLEEVGSQALRNQT